MPTTADPRETTGHQRRILAQASEFDLGPLHVNPSRRRVSLDDRAWELEPRAMHVLIVLAAARPKVVSRDELIEACWGRRIVSDDAVNRVIMTLRNVARRASPPPFQLETVRGVGYCLLVPEGTQAETRSGAPSTPSAAPDGRRAAIVGAAALALAFGGGAYAIYRKRQLPAAARAAMDAGMEAFRQLTPDQVAQAIAAFQRAASLAPSFAEPWAQLALAYQYQRNYGAPPEAFNVLTLKTREAASRALAIEPQNPDAQTALAALNPIYGAWLQFDVAVHGVLDRHSENFSINRIARDLFLQTGQLTRALQCTERALALDSAWPKLVTTMAATSWALGQIEQADAWIGRASARWPRHSSVWFTQLRLLTYTARPAKALAMLADVANRPIGVPDWNLEQSRLEAVAIATGAPKDVAAAAESYRTLASRGSGFAANAVQFLSAVGRPDEALKVLDAILDRGAGDLRYSAEQGQFTPAVRREIWFLWLPTCERLRADSRLAGRLRQIGLVDYWRRRDVRPDIAVAGL